MSGIARVRFRQALEAEVTEFRRSFLTLREND